MAQLLPALSLCSFSACTEGVSLQHPPPLALMHAHSQGSLQDLPTILTSELSISIFFKAIVSCLCLLHVTHIHTHMHARTHVMQERGYTQEDTQDMRVPTGGHMPLPHPPHLLVVNLFKHNVLILP